MKPLKLKWLIAHQPAYLFVRTAKAFVKEIDKTCPGEFEIEILTMKDFIKKYPNEVPGMHNKPTFAKGIEADNNSPGVFKEVPWREIGAKWNAFFAALREQKFDISQTQVTVLGGHVHRAFQTLDLPFLFTDHDHATRVLDGSIGQRMRAKFTKATGIHSLAFTYSGGFRVIGSSHDIEDVAQLMQTKMQSVPITTPLFKEIGSDAKSRMCMDIDETNDHVEGGAVETTYLRFAGTNVLKTNHSMFLTSIICGEKLLAKLSDKQQKAFKDAAFKVGKIERKWSLEDCAKYERDAEANGVQIREVSAEEDELLRTAASKSYDAFFNTKDRKFGNDDYRVDLVQEIRKA
jgi:TRAP-type C4-dicarboxylate transport system substrate-binding protein